jgi:uncharacterized protein with HEPN domain
MDRDQASILDIVKMARLIGEFTAGARRQDLESDPRLRFAVLHAILIIGEAAKRLTPAFRAAHTDVPWKQIAGMRDRLVHGYDDVDLDTVWDVISTHAPYLLARLEPLLPPKPESEP